MLLFLYYHSRLGNIIDFFSYFVQKSAYQVLFILVWRILKSKYFFFFELLATLTVLCSPQHIMTELQFDLELYHMFKTLLASALREGHFVNGYSYYAQV